MEASYEDITSRIKDKPKWWDINGVPRFDKFTPDQCPDIYAKEVVLLKIACQSCNKRFRVEMHGGVFNRIKHPHKLHYGDPPRHKIDGIGCLGDTMNSDALAVLEVWHKDSKLEWERVPELEGFIDAEEGEQEKPSIPVHEVDTADVPFSLPNESMTKKYVGKIHRFRICMTPGAFIDIESFHKMPNALRRLAAWLILGWTYEERKERLAKAQKQRRRKGRKVTANFKALSEKLTHYEAVVEAAKEAVKIRIVIQEEQPKTVGELTNLTIDSEKISKKIERLRDALTALEASGEY